MRPRPVLQAHARVLRRGPDAVQIGLVDGAGIVVSGLRPDEVESLERLDGQGSSDGSSVYADSTRLAGVIDALADANLLVRRTTPMVHLRPIPPVRVRDFAADAAARACAYGLPDDGFGLLATRSRQSVLIDGAGRLARELLHCLRDGGVGHLSAGRRAVASADSVARSGRGRTPTLVVLLAEGALPYQRAEGWRSRDIPHLPVVLDGPVLRVGPLVAGAGPCLHCLDLHRADRDPQWPAVTRQLHEGPMTQHRAVVGESALRALAVGLASSFVYAYLDGRPVTRGLSVSMTLPSPESRSQEWTTHPRCPDCSVRVRIRV